VAISVAFGSHYGENEMSATTYKIIIYYDDSDTANCGWSYFIRDYDRDGSSKFNGTSGDLPQSRRNASLRPLRRALARDWPAFPQAARNDAAWTASAEGDGWECSIPMPQAARRGGA